MNFDGIKSRERGGGGRGVGNEMIQKIIRFSNQAPLLQALIYAAWSLKYRVVH